MEAVEREAWARHSRNLNEGFNMVFGRGKESKGDKKGRRGVKISRKKKRNSIQSFSLKVAAGLNFYILISA